MNLDRDHFAKAWDAAFGETLETGLERAKLLMKRFGVMARFEEGEGGRSVFDAQRVTMDDADFMRIAVLAMAGVTWIQDKPAEQVKQLGMDQ